MNSIEKTKKELIQISKSLIIHYLKNEHSNFPNIDVEIKRINEIFRNINFEIEPMKKNQSTKATRNRNDNSIIYYANETEDFSNTASALSGISHIIHELSHIISTEATVNHFLEEGMVQYFTSKVVRYSVHNPPNIDSISKEELAQVLNKQELIDGYKYPCEFVSNLNIIMSLNDIDAECEYFFNRNGTEKLTSLAYAFSKEFGDIISSQNSKDEISSINFQHEYKFFSSYFPQINFETLSDTDIQYNEVLMEYFIYKNLYKKYPKVLNIAKELSSDSLKRYIKSLENNISKEQFFDKIQKLLPSPEYSYKLCKTADEFKQQYYYIVSLYSKIPRASFRDMDILSVLIAYDMAYKHIPRSDLLKIVDQYYELIGNSHLDRLMLYAKTLDYLGDINQKLDTNILKILNDKIYSSKKYDIQIPRPDGITSDNIWQKFETFGKATLNFNQKYNLSLYQFYFSYIKCYSYKYFSEDRLYTFDDYKSFTNQMENILKQIDFPEYMIYAGNSPDYIFIKSLSDAIPINSPHLTEQIIFLLQLLNDKNLDLNLGYDFSPQFKGAELDEFCMKINLTWKSLCQNKDDNKKQKFLSCIDDLCFTSDKLIALTTILKESPDCKIRSIQNSFIYETLSDIREKYFTQEDKINSKSEVDTNDTHTDDNPR